MKINFKHPAWIPVYIVLGLFVTYFLGYTFGSAPFKVKCMNYAEIYQYEDWHLIGGTCHYKKDGVWKSEYEWERLR